MGHHVSVDPVDDAGIDVSHPFQTPAEISEARLRTSMDLEAPMPLPIFEIPPDWGVAQSAVRMYL